VVSGVQAAAASLIVNADVHASAAVAVSKLAPGTNGHVLTTSAGVAAWAAAAGASLPTGCSTLAAVQDVAAAGLTSNLALTDNAFITLLRFTDAVAPQVDGIVSGSGAFRIVIIRRALANQPIPLYAKGENRRDWLYVTDHCDAIEAVIRAKGGDGKVFHVSADSERRNIDVAKQVLALLGKPESLITFVADRPGHDWRYALDATSCHALGWKPSVNFDEGLRRTVEWYQGRIASEAAL
jgi:nucleoside-diphosphate-sugar epimerase